MPDGCFMKIYRRRAFLKYYGKPLTLFSSIIEVEFKKSKKMKKIGYFFLLCLCVIGAIGGVGYAIYCGAWPIAIGVGVLTYSAWPRIKEYFTKLTL